MGEVSDFLPEGYESLTMSQGGEGCCEHIASYKAENVLVRLRVYGFDSTGEATKSRNFRNYLRRDVGFMDDLDHPNVLGLFDYSETRKHFWIATRPAKVERLSDCFERIRGLSFDERKRMVGGLLSGVEYIHSRGIVHRNLCGESVFCGSGGEIYVGDFGAGCYLSDGHTISQESSFTTERGLTYVAPEVKDYPTANGDVRSDVYSAGLVAGEILLGCVLSADAGGDVGAKLRRELEVCEDIKSINDSVLGVLIKATEAKAEDRWSSIKELSAALKRALAGEDVGGSVGGEKGREEFVTQAVDRSSGGGEVESDFGDNATIMATGAGGLCEDADAAIGQIWNNRYEIIAKIGGGGQAVVYKAIDHLTSEEIAVKTLLSRHRRDKSAIDRLKQEAMVARSLTHRYIIKTYSVEQREGVGGGPSSVYICMELISSGLELKDVIDKRFAEGKGFSVKEVLHVTGQLLDALRYAHGYTIHRDIKPGNIMLVRGDGEIAEEDDDLTAYDIRLMDFGIAKVLTRKHIEVTGKGFWSAHYGAPELADVKSTVDARADLYSAGVVMYQMLTGRIPRKGSPSASKVNKDASAELGRVIDKVISNDREERYRSAAVFAKEIEKAVSKFSWVLKTAKAAAAVVIVAGAAIAVRALIPESERLGVDASIALLEGRGPETLVSEAGGDVIKLSDIAGCDDYDVLRREALASLGTLKSAENNDFASKFAPWSDQQQRWLDIEPLVSKAKRIQDNIISYNSRKGVPAAASLMQLQPGSSILSGVIEKVQAAEGMFKARPLSKQVIESCDEAYATGASVYTNIEEMSGGASGDEGADKINELLKGAGQLRGKFVSARGRLGGIAELQGGNFEKWSELCLVKGNGQYDNFELEGAEQMFSLLSQTCGTLSDVSDQIDFRGSDIGLIVSRLMQLCYEDIETFENYPEWREELRKVYEKKDLLGQYGLLQEMISNGAGDVGGEVYSLLDEVRSLGGQGDVAKAREVIGEAFGEYAIFIGGAIADLERDCERLAGIVSVVDAGVVDIEKVSANVFSLGKLRDDVDGSVRIEMRHVEEYNSILAEVSAVNGAVRKDLGDKAVALRASVTEKAGIAGGGEYFWGSESIGGYIGIGNQYGSDAVGRSIEGWGKVDDVSRIAEFVSGLRELDLRLGRMLDRKKKLDDLSVETDEGISFCEKFTAASEQEREDRVRWLSGLRSLRKELDEKKVGGVLIDRSEREFASEYVRVHGAVGQILVEIPRNSNRVEYLIKQAEYVETAGAAIESRHEKWRSITGDLSGEDVGFSSVEICEGLKGIKGEVDSWDDEKFSGEMILRCRLLSAKINNQCRMVGAISKAVAELYDRLGEITNDEDVIELRGAGGESANAKVVEILLKSLGGHEAVFNDIESDMSDDEIVPATFYSDFNLSIWIERWGGARKKMVEGIGRLESVAGSIGGEAGELLAGEESIERLYYDDLKEVALSAVREDYEGAAGMLAGVENDSELKGMCDFLEKMENANVPTLGTLRQSLGAVSGEVTKLEGFVVTDLEGVKGFNGGRKKVLAGIAGIRGDVGGMDKVGLETACKESVSSAGELVKESVGEGGRAKACELSGVLWSFYAGHEGWGQWKALFGELFHVDVLADGTVGFASMPEVMPVDEDGDVIVARGIGIECGDYFNIDCDESVNFGWPKYCVARKDASVGLVFVPAGSGKRQALYMGAYEINNAQYRRYLEQSGAAASLRPKGWSRFQDAGKKDLVCSTSFDYPASSIKWDEQAGAFVVSEEKEDLPLGWVTFHGAMSYADWLGGRLPDGSEFEYACRSGGTGVYPWGDDLSQISGYAHVRSAVWQHAANEYNSMINNPLDHAPPPVGAIKDFRQDKDETLDTGRVVHTESVYSSAWPIANANKPNSWGLYDMIGNVWEWCEKEQGTGQSVICGGSCLSPPEYAAADSRYEFQGRASDIGFRVVVPAR